MGTLVCWSGSQASTVADAGTRIAEITEAVPNSSMPGPALAMGFAQARSRLLILLLWKTKKKLIIMYLVNNYFLFFF